MNDPVLDAVLDLKGDVGEVKAALRSMNAWMQDHAREDREAHERISNLELRAATQRGRAAVWQIAATGAGALFGYMAQFLIGFFTGRHP